MWYNNVTASHDRFRSGHASPTPTGKPSLFTFQLPASLLPLCEFTNLHHSNYTVVQCSEKIAFVFAVRTSFEILAKPPAPTNYLCVEMSSVLYDTHDKAKKRRRSDRKVATNSENVECLISYSVELSPALEPT